LPRHHTHERKQARQSITGGGSFDFGAFNGLFWAYTEKSLIWGYGKLSTIRKIFFLRNLSSREKIAL
jgi:hypothetical protein